MINSRFGTKEYTAGPEKEFTLCTRSWNRRQKRKHFF